MCGNLYLCRTHFVELDHLDHNRQTILELAEEFSRKMTMCVFHSSWKNLKKKHFLGKDKLGHPLALCVFLQPFPRSVCQTVKKAEVEEKK